MPDDWIRQWGDPALREVAAPVVAADDLLRRRVQRMADRLLEFEEGCLSFMAVTVAVVRPVAVRVEAFDLDGRALTVDAEGGLASLMQHEIDHLDGILTLDRAEPAERRRAIAVLCEGDRLPALRHA